jgi:Transposase.
VDRNVSPLVIHRLWHRYDETGQFTRRVGQGRERMTSLQDDRYLTIRALRRRSATARELQQDLRRVTGVTVSDQTVRNRLREVSLRPRLPVRVPRLTEQHRPARLLFIRSHVNWKLRQWRPVLFTDEYRFPLTQRHGRQHVWRRRNEQYILNVVQEGDRFGQCSVLLWGDISIDGRTDLVFVHFNLTAAGTSSRYCYNMCWMLHTVLDLNSHDNARAHVLRITRVVLQELNIQEMEWQAVGLDLNPIEHEWNRVLT